VRPLLADATQLLISPDGALSLIPFEALVDERGQYQITRYSFTYLTSGRDLLRMQVLRPTAGSPVVVADPLFGEPALAAHARNAADAASPKSRDNAAAGPISSVYFAPLSGTAQEARIIKSLFPETSLLTGAQATTAAVKHLAAPAILH